MTTHTTLQGITLALIAAFFIAIAQVFLKLGSEQLPTSLSNWHIFIALLVYVIANGLFILALKKGTVSTLTPLIASAYLWVALFSLFLFNEAIGLIKAGGILFIIIGVILISWNKKRQSNNKESITSILEVPS